MRKEIIYLIMTIVGALLLLGSTILMIVMWPQVPDRVPTHFNFAGEADAYGGKGALIGLCVLAWVMFIGLTILMKFPNTWNIPVKVTAENRARLYGITKGMLEVTKFLVVLLMVVLLVGITIAAQIPKFLMMALVAAILLAIIIGMYLLFKNR